MGGRENFPELALTWGGGGVCFVPGGLRMDDGRSVDTWDDYGKIRNINSRCVS